MDNKEILTYSLAKANRNSDSYYINIESYAHSMINEIDEQVGTVAARYQNYIEKQHIEAVRTIKEYELELLVLGVLWRVYGRRSQRLEKGIGCLIRNVVKLRKRIKYLKPFFSTMKGNLSSKYLVKKEDILMSDSSYLDVSMEAYSRLLLWLESSGEFEQEVIRLSRWKKFFLVHTDCQNYIATVLTMAKDFEESAKKQLGEYTTNVLPYQQQAYTTHYQKEDVIFCTRYEVEYHLNMFGAQILNEVYHEEFGKAKEKLIYLPGCMTYQKLDMCKAKASNSGYICKHCTSQCPVNQITEIAKVYHAKVVIVYHESSLYKQKVENEKSSIGVIGVACVLNLLSGGWKAKDLGYVPQCVLLDYCGCKGHWHQEGIVTNLNKNQLIHILSGSEVRKA